MAARLVARGAARRESFKRSRDSRSATHRTMVRRFTVLACALASAGALVVPARVARRAASTALQMSWQPNTNFNGESSSKLTDFERSAREAGALDRTVTIRKPLGLILDANADGDVYVKEIVKGGNAEAAGGVKVGDTIAMASATFGNQMWSTRGVGLQRVMRAIEVRAGQTVSLVVQSKAEQKSMLSNLFGAYPAVRPRLPPLLPCRPSATRRHRRPAGEHQAGPHRRRRGETQHPRGGDPRGAQGSLQGLVRAFLSRATCDDAAGSGDTPASKADLRSDEGAPLHLPLSRAHARLRYRGTPLPSDTHIPPLL